jgi:transcriptional regulator with XRE-family HTH domain
MPRPKRFPTDRQVREKVARRVQQARTQRGWTRERLAEALDVVPETVWRYESSRLPLSLTMLYKVAVVMGVPVEALVGDEGYASDEAELVAAWRSLDEGERNIVLYLARRLSGGSMRAKAAEKLAALHVPAGQGR